MEKAKIGNGTFFTFSLGWQKKIPPPILPFNCYGGFLQHRFWNFSVPPKWVSSII